MAVFHTCTHIYIYANTCIHKHTHTHTHIHAKTSVNGMCSPHFPLSPRTVAVSVPGGRFGAGSGRVYLTGLQCAGNESALLDCPRAVSGVQGCGHSQDAGVVCTGRLLVICACTCLYQKCPFAVPIVYLAVIF